MRAPISSAEPERLSLHHAESLYAAPRVGATLGSWRLVEPLARGGTAQVWRGIDVHGASAALKLAPVGREEALRAEYAVLAAAPHPHLVQPLELIETEGHALALALEYVDGGDLIPLLGAPPRHWLRSLNAVVAAVAHLHDGGIAHRDLKARNVLLTREGVVRVVDLASASDVDAAPDSRRGTTAAHRPARQCATGRETDQFALAVLAYELATGRLPFGIDGRRRLDEPPAPWLRLGGGLDALMAVVAALLTADGRGRGGLSTLADVIESAAAEADEHKL